jgi:hypothetical protein
MAVSRPANFITLFFKEFGNYRRLCKFVRHFQSVIGRRSCYLYRPVLQQEFGPTSGFFDCSYFTVTVYSPDGFSILLSSSFLKKLVVAQQFINLPAFCRA